jgi:hypothetical protein
MEDNIIDYGVWTCPKSWDDITLKKYQDIEIFYEGKDKHDVRDIIHILCDKTPDEVNALPLEFLDEIMENMLFLNEAPKIEKPSNIIEIDKEKYQVNIMEKLKTGEWVAFDTVLKNDRHNYAAMLAILCRKEGEMFDSKFEAEIFEDRVKLFEKQPITKILPIITFFLTCWLTLEKHSQLYTQVEAVANHILNNIETSEKLGAFKKRYLKWRVKKLIKSIKQNKNTSQTSSHSLRSLSRKVKWKNKKRNFKKI